MLVIERLQRGQQGVACWRNWRSGIVHKRDDSPRGALSLRVIVVGKDRQVPPGRIVVELKPQQHLDSTSSAEMLGRNLDVSVRGPADQAERHSLGQEEDNNSQNPEYGNQARDLGNQTRTNLLDRKPDRALRRVVGVAWVPTVDIFENDLSRDAGADPDDLTEKGTAAGKVDASGGRIRRGCFLAGPVMRRGNPRSGRTWRRNPPEIFDTQTPYRLVRISEGSRSPDRIPADGGFPRSDGDFTSLSHVPEGRIEEGEQQRYQCRNSAKHVVRRLHMKTPIPEPGVSETTIPAQRSQKNSYRNCQYEATGILQKKNSDSTAQKGEQVEQHVKAPYRDLFYTLAAAAGLIRFVQVGGTCRKVRLIGNVAPEGGSFACFA
jgi:hypothetical protein